MAAIVVVVLGVWGYFVPAITRINYFSTTQVLVASVRGPEHVVEAGRLGADICTCPAKVIDQLFNHPLTDIGLKNFLADWEKAHATAKV